MKRAVSAVVMTLCAVLLLSSFKAGSAVSDVYFTSVNDTLFDLADESMPIKYNGAVYVPYTTFTNSILQTYAIYHRITQTVSVIMGDLQLNFDLAEKWTYDNEGNEYDFIGIYQQSVPYLPVAKVCAFFGMHYSYITSSPVGDIVRIRNSSAQLSDSDFAQMASMLMQDRLTSYLQEKEAQSKPGAPEQTAQPPSVTAAPNYSDLTVYLNFRDIDAENAGIILSSLELMDYKATFYMTAAEIEENGDLARRIFAQGHQIGIMCTGEDLFEDYKTASKALFEACNRLTIFVASDSIRTEERREAVLSQGLIIGFDGLYTANEMSFEELRYELSDSYGEKNAGF